jgi:hypothetical protein
MATRDAGDHDERMVESFSSVNTIRKYSNLIWSAVQVDNEQLWSWCEWILSYHVMQTTYLIWSRYYPTQFAGVIIVD